jgi:hypothetical protein
VCDYYSGINNHFLNHSIKVLLTNSLNGGTCLYFELLQTIFKRHGVFELNKLVTLWLHIHMLTQC